MADSLKAIREQVGDFRPEVMLTLGSGLSDAVKPADIYYSMPYSRIPGLTPPSVAGHPGKVLFGSWGGKRLIMFQGRLHFYEGHPWQSITLPVSIAAEMGVSACVFTNSSGAIHAELAPGDILIIDDHMNFMGANPLVGVTANDPSTMFPDMGEAYSPRLRRLLDQCAAMLGISIAHGIYAAVAGPNYETPAEVRALALLGADVVGMSTVGEVLMARKIGLECCALSCVANMGAGVTNKIIRHEEGLSVVKASVHNLASLLDSFIRNI